MKARCRSGLFISHACILLERLLCTVTMNQNLWHNAQYYKWWLTRLLETDNELTCNRRVGQKIKIKKYCAIAILCTTHEATNRPLYWHADILYATTVLIVTWSATHAAWHSAFRLNSSSVPVTVEGDTTSFGSVQLGATGSTGVGVGSLPE